MTEKSTSTKEPKTPHELGRELLSAFKYQNATISELELTTSRSAMSATKQELSKAVQWLRSESFIEAADEVERIRLTPQGRSVWRDVTGHA